jgi:iron complex outermembrane receptor protein
MMNRVRLTMLTGIAASAFWGTQAYAQTPGSGTDAVGNDDIVVTAQRREERLIDVPISVSAMGAEALDRAGVTNVSNIGNYVPNIQINQTVGNTFGPLISIRGLAPSADTSLGRDQPVGLYIDGVPIAKSTGAAFDIADLERVEVLRGPQGTLYGKNTIGGAVNLITRKPSGEFGGSIVLGAGTHDLFTERVTLDLPAIGTVGEGFGAIKAKLSYNGRQFDGFYKNTGPSRDFGRQRLNAGRADVLWELNDRFSARYVYDINDSKGTGAMLAISAPGSIAPGTAYYYLIEPAIHTTRPKSIAADNVGQNNFRVSGHAVTLEYHAGSGALGDVTLKSITAWRKLKTRSYSDFDGTPYDLLRFRLNNDYKQFSQEFQVIGDAGRLKYTLGAFYMRDKYAVFNPRWNFRFGADGKYDLSERGANNHSIAGYGQVTWTPPMLEDKLDIAVGLRWTKDTRDVWERFLSYNTYAVNPADLNSGVFQRNPDGSPILASGGPALGALPGGSGVGPEDLIPLRNKKSWSQLSPELNLTYKVSPTWNIYGRVATGFKSGGFNDTAANNAAFNTPYNPEKLLSFELGTKGSFFDRKLSLNMAVYHSIYKDFQAGVFVPAFITTNIINAGEAQFTGFELEGQIRPVDRLTINFGYGYLHARYKDFVLPSGEDVTHSYKIPLAPKHNVLIGAQHRLPLGGELELVSSLNYSWRSSQWGTITPDVLSRRKAYGVLDGRLSLAGIKFGGDTELELSVWGKNLTDEKYWVSGINLSAFTVRQWADPRSFGFEAKLNF